MRWLRSDGMPRIIHHINSIDNLGLLTTRTNRIGSAAQEVGYESEHNIFKLRKAAKQASPDRTHQSRSGEWSGHHHITDGMGSGWWV